MCSRSSNTSARRRPDGRAGGRTLTDRGLSHVGLICEDLDATRAELESKGVRFLVSGIAEVARVRTTWFVDPWGVVFILVEKSRPSGRTTRNGPEWVSGRPSGSSARGPAGIAMGIQLAEGGYEFTIFDRADGFGGTWRHNTFPGAACDVPSHLYSYSFAPNPRWSKTYANQPEILAYLETVAAGHGLGAHLRANTAVTAARWSDTRRRWTLTGDDGREHEFDVVVSAVGMLDVPHIPDIPGAQRFRGRQFHSARWDHSKSTAGERVASIGTGASAIQYVPAIARKTAQLTVFQRTPIWIAPRFDFPFTAEQHELFERDPARRRNCATRPSTPTSRPASTSTTPRRGRRPSWPAATSCARSPTPSCAPS